MGSNLHKLKTISLFENRDPIRNLWRNVLIVAIEDLVKNVRVAVRFKAYHAHAHKTALEYFMIPNDDFRYVCEYAGFEPDVVRDKVLKEVNRLKLEKGKNGKSYLPKMRGQWILQGKGVNRQPRRSSASMSNV